MSREHQEWTERFSDYLADELDEAARSEIEEHVATCGGCRRALEELREVVARAKGLEERTPPRDLWPGIAAGIGTPVRAAEPTAAARVIALPTAGSEREAPGRGRIALSPPQLAAAAVVLVAASALTTWLVGPGLGVRPEAAVAPEPGASAVSPAASRPAPPEPLSDELAELEEVLQAARERLDPNTVRVLERNLAVIEQAIADSHQALALDPGNEFLTHHLQRVYERKLEYLRDAARVLDWAG